MKSENAKKSSLKPDTSPWAWIPTLYIAEGLPYVLVMTVSTILYARLGVSLEKIGFWTSLLGFAWVIKPLWGPLVDLYWTKRRWTVLMQILMGLLLITAGLSLHTAWWWWGSLGALALVALFSATHDIAADGFYMDALNEKQQAFFVGIRSTFYRIAMIFGQGILLIIIGLMEQHTGPAPVETIVTAAPPGVTASAPAIPTSNGNFVTFEPATISLDAGSTASLTIVMNEQPDSTRTITLKQESSNFLKEFFPYGPERQVALAEKKDETLFFGPGNWNKPQSITFKADENMKEPVSVRFSAKSGNIPLAWSLGIGGVGLLMIAYGCFHFFFMPRPVEDGASETPATPFPKALVVIGGIAFLPVVIYWGIYELIHSGLMNLSTARWGDALPFPMDVLKFATMGLIIFLAWLILRAGSVRSVVKKGYASAARASQIPFDEVFASFFRKPGIKPMLAFLLLYRLGEGLLVKMSGIFLIKPIAQGGMGLTSAQYGFAYGTVGIAALTVGGILGGWVASRYGLKKWLLPMCLAINLPDLFYVYLAYAQPTDLIKVYGAVATESFGYGFGFTAYMLYMLYIAGKGEHKTSHFAICTGFMALGMMLPGMISGALAQSLGWQVFFVIVCLATIPGFIMLYVIPLDPEFGRRSASQSPELAIEAVPESASSINEELDKD